MAQSPNTDISIAIEYPEESREILRKTRPREEVFYNPRKCFDWLFRTIRAKAEKNGKKEWWLLRHFPLLLFSSIRKPFAEEGTDEEDTLEAGNKGEEEAECREIVQILNSWGSCERFTESIRENTAKHQAQLTCIWTALPEDVSRWTTAESDRILCQETLMGFGTSILLMGCTGMGKSSLINALLGFDFEEGPCRTSRESDACTQRVERISGFAFGELTQEDVATSQALTLIDTPGVGEVKLKNEEIVAKLLDFLRRMRFGPNVLILALDINNPRFTDMEKKSILFLKKAFGSGDQLADNLLVIFTKCDPRTRTGRHGWGKDFKKLKDQYRQKISEILGGKPPMDLIPVSVDDPKSMQKIIEIAKQTPKLDTSKVKDFLQLEKEAQEEQIRQQMMDVTKLFEKKLEKVQEELKESKEENQCLQRKLEAQKDTIGGLSSLERYETLIDKELLLETKLTTVLKSLADLEEEKSNSSENEALREVWAEENAYGMRKSEKELEALGIRRELEAVASEKLALITEQSKLEEEIKAKKSELGAKLKKVQKERKNIEWKLSGKSSISKPNIWFIN